MARRASIDRIPFYVKVCASLIVVGGGQGGKRSVRASLGGLEESVRSFEDAVSKLSYESAHPRRKVGVPVV